MERTYFAISHGLHVGTGDTADSAIADGVRHGEDKDEIILAFLHPSLEAMASAGDDPGPMRVYGIWAVTSPKYMTSEEAVEQFSWLTQEIASWATAQGFGQAELMAWLAEQPGLKGRAYGESGVRVLVGESDYRFCIHVLQYANQSYVWDRDSQRERQDLFESLFGS